ncbi:hypothetical protein MRB53_034831 [Persea americana]|uniref:Uncharacterized protein n=1 Tax=Persea americana TaxID=3435 RepID=A0ACC2K2X1_PERAE|nr:hypothetical protein MRB53_034831 [Persea americana]
MDFSLLEGAMASKSYGKIADICDDLMLHATSEGVFSQEGWPYAIHLLGHMYANDMNSARFLWKSIPSTIKESQPEIVAVWKIGQCLWTRNYAGVYEAIRGFDWTPQVLGLVMDFSESYTKRMFGLLVSAYSTISVADTAHFLGMTEEDATNYALQHGWSMDPASRMLTVKRQPVLTEQKLDPRLSRSLCHLGSSGTHPNLHTTRSRFPDQYLY